MKKDVMLCTFQVDPFMCLNTEKGTIVHVRYYIAPCEECKEQHCSLAVSCGPLRCLVVPVFNIGFRRLRGDVIEVTTILTGKYDVTVVPKM